MPDDGGPPVTAAAAVQRRLWGTDPRAWADLAEAHNRPLFEAVLDAAGAGRGTRVLDVGCGSGLALVLATRRGATPSGLDISPGLLGIARDRLTGADLREGDMEFLPFGDGAFDAVLGVNAFQFAGDPRRALREAARVLRPGDHGEVVCRWRYPSMDAAVTSLLCSAGGAQATEAAGEQAVRDVLRGVLTQFQDPPTGFVTMANTFRWVAARR